MAHSQAQHHRSRLILVSNRLPVTVEEKNGQINIKPSAGGLATGLGSFYRDGNTIWVGWPGQVNKSYHKEVKEILWNEFGCAPVFLPERLAERYYEGFCNRTIWPLFHSFQGFAKYSSAEWAAYVEANQKFMQVLQTIIQPGDTVWIHDYQLMLLPGLLRKQFPDTPSGFFLHIPFPSFDVLRLMPQHKQILESLVGCDLIGFHTNDYARAFLNSVLRILGREEHMGQLMVGDRVVRTAILPMGIDFERFSTTSAAVTGSAIEERLKDELGGLKLIFSVSRLDYTKGLLQSLEAVELLLEKQPELHEKVAYLLAVVPSREKVDRYAALKREVDEAVGRINARFGRVGWTPIRYIYRHLDFEELVLLYKMSHVAIVTPLRDGMNLIAKEYVASRNDDQGVLILGENAGAAKELIEALTVNPNSREELAEALSQALEMDETEQMSRMHALRERVKASTVQRWAHQFCERLSACTLLTDKLRRGRLAGETLEDVEQSLRNAKRRLFILDYDGTLMPFAKDSQRVQPDADLLQILRDLTANPAHQVLILSGRDRVTLEKWLSGRGLALIGEHGAWIKWTDNADWSRNEECLRPDWKPDVRGVLEAFTERIPGSYIEEKDYSLVWHYRRSDADSAGAASKDLVFSLLSTIGNRPVRIVPGSKTIEVRAFGIGKGSFIAKHLDLDAYDFVFAAGDDLTDEDMFEALPEKTATVKVGRGFSKARFRVKDPAELRWVLRRLTDPAEPSEADGSQWQTETSEPDAKLEKVN